MTTRFLWTDAEVRAALELPATAEGPTPAGEVPAFNRISTDSRTVGPGDLFVALRGERFDGHHFLEAARDRGARGAVVALTDPAADPEAPGFMLYRVPDTLVAFGALAHHRRRALPARVVAITGSSGKTSVKDLLAAALATGFEVHATSGNLNNRIGVPRTLLDAPATADFIVLEVGTSEPGEIAILAAISDPDAALVTTVSEAHLSGLGSLAGVLEEKLDLIRGTRSGGPVVVGDLPMELPRRAREIHPDVHVAGLSERAGEEARAQVTGAPDAGGRFPLRWGGVELRAPLPGRHGVSNLAAALTMARLLGIEPARAVAAVAGMAPRAMRGEVRGIGGLSLLVDCYNANPQSTLAALELLGEMPAERRVAFLASMLELGARSGALHREVVERAIALPIDIVVGVGEFAVAIDEHNPATVVEGQDSPVGTALIPAATAEAGYDALQPLLEGTETILLKGSRGMALERLLPRFDADFGGS